MVTEGDHQSEGEDGKKVRVTVGTMAGVYVSHIAHLNMCARCVVVVTRGWHAQPRQQIRSDECLKRWLSNLTVVAREVAS